MSGAAPQGNAADLLVLGAELVATVDDERREISGGWVAIRDGLVSAVGGSGRAPAGGDGHHLEPPAAWSPPA